MSGNIEVMPGSADDPERDRVFREMQLACAGRATGAVFAAHIDSLAAVVVLCSKDRRHMAALVETLQRDLAKAIDRNWDVIRSQMAHTPRDAGNA